MQLLATRSALHRHMGAVVADEPGEEPDRDTEGSLEFFSAGVNISKQNWKCRRQSVS